MARRRRELATLLPERHPDADLFICDILDATPKGDQVSMQYPLFSLSVKKDLKPFEYRNQRNGASLIIAPAEGEGRANIFDRDILIYVLSQLMAAQKQGRPIGRRVRVCAYDLLRATNRHTTGPAYKTLKSALRRLQYTRIETNIQNDGLTQWRLINFITDAQIIKEDSSGRMIDVEIELGKWLLDAVERNNVLTLNPRYFRLRKPLQRRLYEIARKQCGSQREWKIGLDLLKERCGSTSTLKEFRRLVKAIIDEDRETERLAGLDPKYLEDLLPDYRFHLEADIFTVRPRAEFTAVYQEREQRSLPFVAPLSGSAIEKAREVAPGWCPHELERRWRAWSGSKEDGKPVRNREAAFVGFCRSVYEREGRPR